MNIKLSAAVLSGKVAAWLSRLRGYRGSSLPGMIALRINDGTLRRLARQVRYGIIVVSGTNGKTTTSNMIADMLVGAGYKIIANREGANLITGVTTAFVMNASAGGKIDCDYAILEVDEASIPGVLKEITPKVVVLTNFFRDQLDRYWELEKVTGIIRNSISKLKDTTLVLNADDPLVAQFSQTTGCPALFYGLAGSEGAGAVNTRTREAKFCPFCRSSLEYEYFNYGQLGKYRCSGCDFRRPQTRLEAHNPEINKQGISWRITFDRREAPLQIQVQGLYNLYNALAAFSVGLLLGVRPESILESLRRYRPVTGRMELFKYRGKPVYLILVKNPTGFNEALGILYPGEETLEVFIAINDNDADGKDVSWLWDVDFETLGMDHRHLLRFICTGQRGEEMAVRLKYAGVPVDKIIINTDLHRAIQDIMSGGAGTACLFCTYTALWPVHKIVKEMSDKEISND